MGPDLLNGSQPNESIRYLAGLSSEVQLFDGSSGSPVRSNGYKTSGWSGLSRVVLRYAVTLNGFLISTVWAQGSVGITACAGPCDLGL